MDKMDEENQESNIITVAMKQLNVIAVLNISIPQEDSVWGKNYSLGDA